MELEYNIDNLLFLVAKNKNISKKGIISKLPVNETAGYQKINGKSELKLGEAKLIKDYINKELGLNLTVDKLFFSSNVTEWNNKVV